MHDASGSGSPFGNPSSELVYDDLDTMIGEINANVTLFEDYFFRANYGQDMIDFGNGLLRDTEFLSADSGSPSFRSHSKITGLDVWYVTIDGGWTYYRTVDTILRVFLGYQHWVEEYTARGLTIVECTPAAGVLFFDAAVCPSPLPFKDDEFTGETAVTNRVEWDSLRVGLTADVQLTRRFRLSGEIAWIPYTDMHNEDSHHLRVASSGPGECVPVAPLVVETPDLASVPNIIMDGNGWGWQGDIELLYEFADNISAFLGFRYWGLTSDGDVTFKCGDGSSITFPLNDLDTERYGVTAGFTYTFDS